MASANPVGVALGRSRPGLDLSSSALRTQTETLSSSVRGQWRVEWPPVRAPLARQLGAAAGAPPPRASPPQPAILREKYPIL